MGQITRCLTTIAAGIVVLATVSVAQANPVATFDTSLGSFQVELFADDAPLTVANFLNYVNDGDYDGTFIHRTVLNFVVQGGGYAYPGMPVPTGGFPGSPPHISTDPPISNEFGHSNLRGTTGMAKTSDPNSATSEWFFNTSDNLDLDNPANSGGFTVFGRVIGNGMQIVDAIGQVPRYNAGGPFGSLPLRNFNIGVDTAVSDQHFVMINSIRVPEPATLVYAAASLVILVLSCSRWSETRRHACANRSETASDRFRIE